VPTSPPTSPLYTTHIVSYSYLLFHVQPEDGHCQAPKQLVVPYVVNTIYTSIIKESCVRQVHTLHISLIKLHFVGLYYTIILQDTVQKKHKTYISTLHCCHEGHSNIGTPRNGFVFGTEGCLSFSSRGRKTKLSKSTEFLS